MFHLPIRGGALRFRRCKNSSMEPRGRLTGRQSISCQPLCVSRVFGSYFKFRQKGAERLPGKQLSTGTDFPPCLRWHKNSLQHCWIAVGAISHRDNVKCLWLRSIIASFSSLSTSYYHHLPPLNLPPSLPQTACEGAVACEELEVTIVADRAGSGSPYLADVHVRNSNTAISRRGLFFHGVTF